MASDPQDSRRRTRRIARRHLLLDSRIVHEIRNAELTLGPVRKHPGNPLFSEDQPWEMRFDNLYANVIFDNDDQLYKVWYSPFIVDHSAKGMSVAQWQAAKYQAPYDREMGICYATSEDGLAWSKPSLRLVEYAGDNENNILWRGSAGSRAKRAGPHGSGIFKDRDDVDPERRYKAMLKSEQLAVSFSEDGIHWGAPIHCPEANSAGDTHNNAFWAPTLDKYVGITRQWSETYQRQVARTESADFLHWSPTETILQGIDERHHTYAMPAFFHSGVYLGLLAIHDQESDRVWTELTWSADTETWHRICPGTAFIENSKETGTYDWGCVFAAACPIFEKDHIRLYYGGNDGLHTSWRNGYFCLATLRPDGFAGYTASDESEEARVTTELLPAVDGDELKVTADIGNGGELIVRELTQNGGVLRESRTFTQSVTDEVVRWTANPNTHAQHERIRIEFAFKRSTVYAFALAEPEGGR